MGSGPPTIQQTVRSTNKARLARTAALTKKGLAAVCVNYTYAYCRRIYERARTAILDLRIHLRAARRIRYAIICLTLSGQDLEIKTLLMDDGIMKTRWQALRAAQASVLLAANKEPPITLIATRRAAWRWNKDGPYFHPAAYAETPPWHSHAPLQGASLKPAESQMAQRAMRIFSARFWRKGDAALIQWDATAATLKALGCHL